MEQFSLVFLQNGSNNNKLLSEGSAVEFRNRRQFRFHRDTGGFLVVTSSFQFSGLFSRETELFRVKNFWFHPHSIFRKAEKLGQAVFFYASRNVETIWIYPIKSKPAKVHQKLWRIFSWPSFQNWLKRFALICLNISSTTIIWNEHLRWALTRKRCQSALCFRPIPTNASTQISDGLMAWSLSCYSADVKARWSREHIQENEAGRTRERSPQCRLFQNRKYVSHSSPPFTKKLENGVAL